MKNCVRCGKDTGEYFRDENLGQPARKNVEETGLLPRLTAPAKKTATPGGCDCWDSGSASTERQTLASVRACHVRWHSHRVKNGAAISDETGWYVARGVSGAVGSGQL